jgi:hypothetical protein
MNMKQLIGAGVAALLLPGTMAVAGSAFGCWADITLDHQVSTDDLIEVILSWGPCQAAPPPCNPCIGGGDEPPPPPAFCAADIAPAFDPDGMVDVDDLVSVITNWGECTTPPPGAPGHGYVVWCEDWTPLNYDRWTSEYNNDENPCTLAGFTGETFNSPVSAMKSQIFCAGGINGVHRGYGGLRFQGEELLPSFTIPSSGGIDSVHGIVMQWRAYLSVPYLFNSQDHDLWLSMMTVTHDCSNAWHDVIVLNIDNESMRLRPSHVDGVQYALGAPAFPRDQWVRVTVYVNLYTGQMHVWQDGIKIANAWFTRPSGQTCQYHWGLYASGANWDITYYEDDLRIIKLTEPLLEFVGEPSFPGLASPCAPVTP